MAAKTNELELNDGTRIPILFENRSVLAIDKPSGWMLVPFTWQRTNRNLHAAMVSAIATGKYWAKSRGLRFLCHTHRLDAETTGILLLARSRGALETISGLFEARKISKRYLAIVRGVPTKTAWSCQLKLAQDEDRIGRVCVDAKDGKPAETHFTVLATAGGRSLIEARPVTGRTHQIRVHLASAGYPVLGDPLYGSRARTSPPASATNPAGAPQGQGRRGSAAFAPGGRPRRETAAEPLALRAIDLAYFDPFTRQPVVIQAPFAEFAKAYGFEPKAVPDFKFP